jgi:heme/copper-type cytochrome/quinol oxidase subunit 4
MDSGKIGPKPHKYIPETMQVPAKQMASIQSSGRWPILALVGLLAWTAGLLLFGATQKKLWFDELFTLYVSRQSTLSDVLAALANAVDLHPPLSYFLTRACLFLFGTGDWVLRVPQIVGIIGALFCIYLFVAKRTGATVGLLSAVLFIGSPYMTYGFEARPYALVLFCTAAALLGYQRWQQSVWWKLLFSVSLISANSLHYYAPLLGCVFGAVEIYTAWRTKSIRRGIWLCLVLSALPLVFPIMHWESLHRYSGAFWTDAADRQDAVRSWVLYRAVPFALIAGAVVFWGTIRSKFSASTPSASHLVADRAAERVPTTELLLVLGLTLLPLVGFLLSVVSKAGFHPRYVVPAIWGACLAPAYFLSMTTQRQSTLRLVALVLAVIWMVPTSVSRVQASIKGREDIPVLGQTQADLRQILAKYSGRVVVTDGINFPSFQHYGSPEEKNRVHYVCDPVAAAKTIGYDTIDRNFLDLRQIQSFSASTYPEFVADHDEFLIWRTSPDWITDRLTEEGYQLGVLERSERGTLFRAVRTFQATPSIESKVKDQPNESRISTDSSVTKQKPPFKNQAKPKDDHSVSGVPAFAIPASSALVLRTSHTSQYSKK